MTPVSRVPQGTEDILWLAGHRRAPFAQVRFGTNQSKSLCDSCLAVHVTRQVKLAVGLL